MSKLEKADLLEMANAYILHLQSSNLPSNPGAVSSYSVGFNACAAEVSKYVETNSDDSSGDLHARLLEHLTSYAASKDVVEKCARDRDSAKPFKPDTSKTLKKVCTGDNAKASSEKELEVDLIRRSTFDSSCTNITTENINTTSLDSGVDSQRVALSPCTVEEHVKEARNKSSKTGSPRRNPLASLQTSPNQTATDMATKMKSTFKRNPLTNMMNIVSCKSVLPMNKQPIRKRLSAQYGRALTQAPAVSCPTLPQTDEKHTSVVFQENQNSNELGLYNNDHNLSADTMKENNLVFDSGVPLRRTIGADKINQMVELTTRVLTQSSNQTRCSSAIRDKNNCTSLTNYHTTDSRCPVNTTARENTRAGNSRLQDEWKGIGYKVDDDVSGTDPVWRPW